MAKYSTRVAAKKLGIDHSTLAKYITLGKVPAPEAIIAGNRVVHAWAEQDIERVRRFLPKIANGRKTRYKKKQLAVSTQPSVEAKPKNKKQEPQPRAAVPHKKR